MGNLSTGVNASAAGDFKPCQSPVVYDSLADGHYSFSVRAQGEQVAATQSFTKVSLWSTPYDTLHSIP